MTAGDCLQFIDIPGDRVYLSYETGGNPFLIASTDELFSARESLNARARDERENARHLTLVERSWMAKPRVPPCETRATRLSRTRDQSEAEGSSSPRRSHGRRPTMHELCDEKRDIYRMQLFIDCKNREIKSFDGIVKQSDKKLAEDIESIASLEDDYRKRTLRIEAAVAQSRKKADQAARAKSEKYRHYVNALQDIERIRSDIMKNREMLAGMQIYQKFMAQFPHPGISLREYFHDPSVLLGELHRIEDDNLRMIENCNRVSQLLGASLSKFHDALNETVSEEKVASEMFDEIEKVDDSSATLAPEQQRRIEENDADYDRVVALVRQTYAKCFSGGGNLSPIAILEQLENEFERMYRVEVLLDPEFRHQKQTAKVKDRREKQRKAKQARQEAEQQRKVHQAIERARKRIPRKAGRNVVARTLPTKNKRGQSERDEIRRREEERQEKLLFGSDD
jgi:hypothetical protein